MTLRAAIPLALVLVSGAGLNTLATAHEFKLGNLEIGHLYARPSVPGQSTAAAYLSLENKGAESDKLVALESGVAKSAQVHTMAMDNNIMRMREVETLELKPAEKISMKPGEGYHLMLIGLKSPLKQGDKFPLTLTFEKAGKVEVMVFVQDKDASAAPVKHQH